MDDKRVDDRDIDEILASIDEMLNQKEFKIYESNDKKDFIQQNANESAHALNLSSTASSEESSLDKKQDELLDLHEDTLNEIEQLTASIDLDINMLSEPESIADITDDSFLESASDYEDDSQPEATTQATPEHDDTEGQAFDDLMDTTKEAEEEINQHLLDSQNIDKNNVSQKPLETDSINPELADVDSINNESYVQETNDHTSLEAELFEGETTENKTLENDETENTKAEDDQAEAERLESENFDAEAAEMESNDQENSDEENSVVTHRHRILLTEALLEPSAQEALPLWIEQDELAASNTEIASNETTPLEETQHADDSSAELKEPAKEDISTVPSISNEEEKLTTDERTAVFDISEAMDENTVYKIETIEHSELLEAMMQDILHTEEKPSKKETTDQQEFMPEQEGNLSALAEAISQEVNLKLQEELKIRLPQLIQEALEQHLTTGAIILSHSDPQTKDTEE